MSTTAYTERILSQQYQTCIQPPNLVDAAAHRMTKLKLFWWVRLLHTNDGTQALQIAFYISVCKEEFGMQFS